MNLSDALHEAADAPDGSGVLDLDAVHARVDRRRRRRSRTRLAGGAVSVLALVAGLAVAVGAGVGDRDSEGTDVRAEAPAGPLDPADPGSDDTTPVTEPPETTDTTSTTAPSSTTTSTEPGDTTTTEPPGSTSTTEPAPTTTEPPATTAPATGLSLQGTYDVASAPGTASCPGGTFPVGLDGTITASDGSRWGRAEQGCATVAGGVYDATGTFVLTAPGGATVTGTFHSVADLPTDGVPYGYQVTGGSGAYAGATGSCQLTVHIVAGGGSLQQRQEGEITCDLTLGGQGPGRSGGTNDPTNGETNGPVPETV